MDEEKKVYEVVGTVTIGTDEYRDLIEKSLRNEIEVDKYRSDWWKERGRADKAEKELDKARERIERLEAFLRTDGEAYARFVLMNAEKERGEL